MLKSQVKAQFNSRISSTFILISVAATICVLTGCSKNNPKQLKDQSKQPPYSYAILITADEHQINDDGTLDQISVGGGSYASPLLVSVNGVPIHSLNGGGVLMPISEFLNNGTNTASISNLAENNIHVFVLKLPSNWAQNGGSIVLASTAKAENGVFHFNVNEKWDTPKFQMLDGPKITNEFVNSRLREFIEQLKAQEGRAVYDQIKGWVHLFLTRNNADQFEINGAENSYVEPIKKFGKSSVLNDCIVEIHEKGVLVQGKNSTPAVSMGEYPGFDKIIFVKIDDEFRIWYLR